MNNRNLINWSLVLAAVVAVIGVIIARVLQAVVPSSALNVVVAVFFTLCVLAIGGLIVAFALRR